MVEEEQLSGRDELGRWLQRSSYQDDELGRWL